MRARIAWVLAGLTLVLVVADVVVTAQYRPCSPRTRWRCTGSRSSTLAVLGCAVMGALIVTRDHRHPIGWLLVPGRVHQRRSLLTEAYSIWVIERGRPGSRSLGGVSGWVSVALRRPAGDRRRSP